MSIYYTKVTRSIYTIISPGNNNDIQPAIQAAVNDAADGDLILLPTGAFILNSVVNITKFVSIDGAGVTKTILYRSDSVPDATLASWSDMFKLDINRREVSNVRITNICFKSKTPSLVAGDSLSLAADKGININNCVGFTIKNNRFENFGHSAISVTHEDDLANGLITGNQFVHNVKGFDGLGLGYGISVFGANLKWIDNPSFGTSNFIFIEDNTFDTHRHAVTGGGCALYVFRYNTIKNNLIAQAIDAHEARLVSGANYYSTRAVEVYGNTMINTTFKDGTAIVSGGNAQNLSNNAILIRGGEAVVYNNTIQGFRFGVGIINFEVTGKQLYPIPYQIGCQSGLTYGSQHSGVDALSGAGDLFCWSNTFTPYVDSAHSSQAFNNFQPEYFKEERDYHLSAKPDYTSYIYPHP